MSSNWIRPSTACAVVSPLSRGFDSCVACGRGQEWMVANPATARHTLRQRVRPPRRCNASLLTTPPPTTISVSRPPTQLPRPRKRVGHRGAGAPMISPPPRAALSRKIW
eukprot:350534-Chlamydomonas_euryale.AAC.3